MAGARSEHTYVLEESDEVTRAMGENAGLTEPLLSQATSAANGNPGAMQALLEIYVRTAHTDQGMFSILCSCCKIKNITGERLYRFVKERGMGGAIEEFRRIGWL